MTPKVILAKLEPRSYAMAVGDKRPGSRYRVSVDGKVIGEVEKHSQASHRSDSTTSRIRYGFRGYSLYWTATESYRTGIVGYVDRTIGYHHYDRKTAIERLVEEYLKETGSQT